MQSNAVLLDKGMRILSEQLGMVEAERFIVALRREPFDCTEWRQNLFLDVPLETFLENAQKHRDELILFHFKQIDKKGLAGAAVRRFNAPQDFFIYTLIMK